MPESRKAEEWYAHQLKEFMLQRYRAQREGKDPGAQFSKDRELGEKAERVDPALLPEEARLAYDYYFLNVERADIGWARSYRVPTDSGLTYAIRATTDGDDGYLEVYDEHGGFVAAGRTCMEVVAWIDRAEMRQQVADRPGELPLALKDAYQRTVWNTPLPGYCNLPCPECSATRAGHCFLKEGHAVAEATAHHCIRCGQRWSDLAVAPSDPPPAAGLQVEVRDNDNHILHVNWLDETLPILTNYGMLNIPAMHVRRIEFGSRMSAYRLGEIADAIAALDSEDEEWRTSNEELLLQQATRAYRPLVLVAEHGTDALQARAAEFAQKIHDRLPPELLEFHKHSIVETKDSRIAGQIEGRFLQTRSAEGQDMQLEMDQLFALDVLGPLEDGEEAQVHPDPLVGLDAWGLEFGKVLSFRITGTTGGLVYGSGPYTLVSHLASTAVHAGQLQPNEMGIVKVEILVSPPSFEGSTRNGITSQDWGRCQFGAYRFVGDAIKLGRAPAEPAQDRDEEEDEAPVD